MNAPAVVTTFVNIMTYVTRIRKVVACGIPSSSAKIHRVAGVNPCARDMNIGILSFTMSDLCVDT